MKRTFLFLLICSMIISAQQASKSQEDSIKYVLSQVTVTATRYTEPIIEVPYAVSVIRAVDLKGMRGYGLDDALKFVPGVLVQTRAGNQDVRLVVRGFGARGAGDRSNYGTSRGVRIMLDGIPETEPDGRTSFDLIDLNFIDNIEVIRSNASATWGNAAGGVINLSTIPSNNNSFASIRGMVGSFGLNQLQVKAGTTLGNGKLYASLSNTNYGGWRKHSSSHRALFNLGIISKLDKDTKLGVFTVGASNVFHVPGPLTKKQFDDNPAQANSFYLQRDERRFNRLGRIGTILDHLFDNNNSVSVMLFASPKYLQRSERNTFRDFTRYHVGGNFMYKNYSELSDGSSNTLIIGGDEAYQDGAILFYNLSGTNQRGDELRTNKREGANNFGAFIQDEIIFNEKLSIIGGFRYDNIVYYSEDFLNPSYGFQEKSFKRVTPKAGLTYRVTPFISLYANLGGGVEVPAGNETDPSSTYGEDEVYLLNPLLEPIISTTYEIGTKQTLFFGDEYLFKSISFDLALYNIDVKNDIIPYRGGRFYFTAGKTNRKGLEFGIDVDINGGVSLKGALTFSKNKYKEYIVDSIHYGKEGKFANYSDNESAGIPNYFYNVTLKYSPNFLEGLFAAITISSVGNYFADDANSIIIPSWESLNLTIGLNKPLMIGDYVSVNGFFTINNLTNVKYVSSAFINPDIVDNEPLYLEPGLPRNYVLSLSIGI